MSQTTGSVLGADGYPRHDAGTAEREFAFSTARRDRRVRASRNTLETLPPWIRNRSLRRVVDMTHGRRTLRFLRVLALCLCTLLLFVGIRDTAQSWGTTTAVIGVMNASMGVLGLLLTNLDALLRRR